MKIKIVKWSDYNSKSDFRTPFWFKVNVNISNSRSLFGLSCTDKWVWICLLSEAMKQKSGEFDLNIEWASHYWHLKKNDILEAIDSLNKNGLLSVDSESTRTTLGPNSAPDKNREDKNRKEKTIGQNEFDLESLYFLYPRKIKKSKGISKLKTAIKNQEDFEKARVAISNYADYCQKHISDSQYIMHFSTFAGEWRDWIEPKTEFLNTKKTDIDAILRGSA